MSSEYKRVSPSRLSPLARPFTLNRPSSSLAFNPSLDTWKDVSISPSASSLAQSFSHICLDTFPNIEANSYYPQDPSRVSQVSADFGVFCESDFISMPIPISNSNNTHKSIGEKQGRRVDHQGILHWKNKNGAVSKPHDAFTELGKPPSEGVKPCGETNDRLCRKSIGISREDNVIQISDPKQIAAECVSFPTVNTWATSNFSTSSDLCSTGLPRDLQNRCTSAPAISSSSCDSIIASYGRGFSQQLDSSADKLNVSLSAETYSLPGLVSEPSDTRGSDSPLNPVLLENVYSEGHAAVCNSSLFSYDPARTKEPHEVMDKSKEIFHDEILKDKGKDGKNGKPVIHEVVDPLLMTKPKLQITSPSIALDLTLKLQVAEEVGPVENSCKMIDENDSDLDSPCWKGTLAVNQSTFGGPENAQHLKSGREACRSLNPLAPGFFPRNDRQSANYCGSECHGDDYLSSPKTVPSAVDLPRRGQRLENLATAGSSSSELSSIARTHCSNDIFVPEKEHTLFHKSSSSSMHCSSCSVQTLVMEDCFTSNGQPLTSPNVRSSMKGIKDDVHNGSNSVSLFASEHIFNSSSCRVGVPSDFNETHGGETRSLSKLPRLNIPIVVNTMNELSELLMRNCNNLDSLNEHEHDIIKRVINNLTVCIRNRIGKKTLMPESSHPYASYCVRKSADIQKCSNMELQATRVKAMLVSHKLGYQDEHERQNRYATSFGDRILDSCSTRKHEGIDKGECITQLQVIKRALEEHQIDEVNPQALLYWNLWLEAEAALCSMKHKFCVLGSKTEIDRCQSDKRYG